MFYCKTIGEWENGESNQYQGHTHSRVGGGCKLINCHRLAASTDHTHHDPVIRVCIRSRSLNFRRRSQHEAECKRTCFLSFFYCNNNTAHFKYMLWNFVVDYPSEPPWENIGSKTPVFFQVARRILLTTTAASEEADSATTDRPSYGFCSGQLR